MISFLFICFSLLPVHFFVVKFVFIYFKNLSLWRKKDFSLFVHFIRFCFFLFFVWEVNDEHSIFCAQVNSLFICLKKCIFDFSARAFKKLCTNSHCHSTNTVRMQLIFSSCFNERTQEQQCRKKSISAYSDAHRLMAYGWHSLIFLLF